MYSRLKLPGSSGDSLQTRHCHHQQTVECSTQEEAQDSSWGLDADDVDDDDDNDDNDDDDDDDDARPAGAWKAAMLDNPQVLLCCSAERAL